MFSEDASTGPTLRGLRLTNGDFTPETPETPEVPETPGAT